MICFDLDHSILQNFSYSRQSHGSVEQMTSLSQCVIAFQTKGSFHFYPRSMCSFPKPETDFISSSILINNKTHDFIGPIKSCVLIKLGWLHKQCIALYQEIYLICDYVAFRKPTEMSHQAYSISLPQLLAIAVHSYITHSQWHYQAQLTGLLFWSKFC